MDYTTNDALNILYRCGIHNPQALLLHLQKGNFEISERTFYRKLDILKNRGIIIDGRQSNGRQKILKEMDIEKLNEYHTKNPTASCPEMRNNLNFPCSPRTIYNSLILEGYKYMRIQETPLMSNKHIQKRLEFATQHSRDHQWKRTFFLDESKFQAFTRNRSCFQKSNCRVTNPKPKHPPQINLIAMISWEGPSRLIIFEETLNSSLFIRYLKLLKNDAEKLYLCGKYRIYMDKDSKHTSKESQDEIKELGLNVPSDWPAVSPDLNPIENVWGVLEKELEKLYPKSLSDLKKMLRSLWKKVATKAYCQKLIDTMPHRLKEVVKEKGHKINY